MSVSDHRGSNYSGGIRQYIRAKLRSNPDYRITPARIKSYTTDMTKSMFCLCPEGWHPWSPRPYYAILMGCIPVIISGKQELAFEEFIHWDAFAVWIRPSDITQLDTVLRSFSDHEIARRRREIQKVWSVFWYPQQQHGLAYHAILKALYNRKYQTTPQRVFSTAITTNRSFSPVQPASTST